MERDVLPDLLKEVQDKFETSYGKSEVVRRAFEELKKKRATYVTANDFALEVGDILAEAFGLSVTGDKLPDGKMYYNIAQRLLTDTLGHNFELVSGYVSQVQEDLNRSANIGLQVQVPVINMDRIDGLVNRLSSEDEFSKVAWMLDEPIVNFTQSIVDDSIKANAEFHYDSGLTPQIIRKEGGKCCDWCREVVGIYQYPRVPKDVYRRHRRCRCTVDYDPKTGKVQNVHSKRWRTLENNDKIALRKTLNLPDVLLPQSLSAKARDIYVKADYPVRGDYRIKSGSKITNVEVIAGKGVRRQIDDIRRLIREHGGNEKDWQKVKGIATLSNGSKIEAHWYQAKNVGKVEFKVKRWL